MHKDITKFSRFRICCSGNISFSYLSLQMLGTAELVQKYGYKAWKPIGFYSRKLNEIQNTYIVDMPGVISNNYR